MNYTYVMYVASSSISSASLLATSLDTEKCIIMCTCNVYVSYVSFEKYNTWTWTREIEERCMVKLSPDIGLNPLSYMTRNISS